MRKAECNVGLDKIKSKNLFNFNTIRVRVLSPKSSSSSSSFV